MAKKKKIIVIEAQRIFRRNKHGMDFVALEMIRSLQQLDRFNQYIIAVGPGEDHCLSATENFRIVVLESSNYLVWEQVLLPRLLKKEQAHLLHCTSNTAPLCMHIPLVLTLHDIIFMEKKIGSNTSMYQNLGRIYRRWIVPKVLKKVHKVITVSDYEQHNIKAAFPQLSQHIITVYNGVSPRFRQLISFSDSRFSALENRSYWLLLGNTDPKKNLKNTLRAYAYYLQESAFKKKMLLADLDEEHLDQLLTELDLHAIKDYLIVEEYIAHDLLVELYNKAFAFLYPSIRESFGLPLLEAMACGTPVITSNTSAIPEVAQDAVVYIDPNDIRSIGDGMLKLEKDAILYDTLIGKGFVRSAQFDWNQTAAKTLDIYEAVHLSK
ncbi:glycosyltransferase family 1 protein [Sphingobacterium sp. JUb56]|uniref:glycosyltransferase family 4 protein n=1 Tax=Sphingobacterium sp. JUb56 TaxID=2587145 RepID=UPI0016197615|nr:glycosyltransferase family 1 protein [Sphingobacterium sp. JUb56]MBB2954322.1 glycosyltransferase involved in cell wall biosynthesis [Sphingobacterium sp. JUb56]